MFGSYGAARASGFVVLGLLAGLYAAQAITGSMVQTALPVVLRDVGMPLDSIGFLSLLFLPWALKFLWAPLVDRYGTERRWILTCQMGLIICFVVASFLPPKTHLMPLSAVLLVMAILATTQDVATDSLGVRATTSKDRHMASGASTTGAYFGFLIGGGLWLPIYSWLGWQASMWLMGGCICCLTLPTLLANRITTSQSRAKAWPTLSGIISNKTLLRGLGFLIIYQSGLRLGISMVGPMMVDANISIAAIGWIKGAGGALAGLLAALIGTAIIQRLGTQRALAIFAFMNCAACIGLAFFAAGFFADVTVLVTFLVFQAVVVAMSFVAIYALMMNWCAPTQIATDFALLQSLDAAIAIIMGVAAGTIGEHLGYTAIFIVALLLLLTGAWRAFCLPAAALGDSDDRDTSFLPSRVQESSS